MEVHHVSIAKELCENVTLIAQYWEDLLKKLNDLEDGVEKIISLLRKSEGQNINWKHRLCASCSASNISSVGTGLFIGGIAGAIATSGASLGLTVAGCFLIGAGVINTESITLCHDQDHLKRELKLLPVYCQNAKLSCENLVELSKDLEERISGQSQTMPILCREEQTKKHQQQELNPHATAELGKTKYYSYDQDPQAISEKHDVHSVSWESYCNASKEFTSIKEIVPVLESLTSDICALVVNEVDGEANISQDIICYMHTLKQKIILTRKCITYKMRLETNVCDSAACNKGHDFLMQEAEEDIQTQKQGIVLNLRTCFDRKLKDAEEQFKSLQSQVDMLQKGIS